MIGEIRDLETANIAINSALTGHLVLSTLHTNSAFLAPQRLIEMGVQPYLVSSVANMIIGQRLVRRLCPHCKIKIRSMEKIMAEYGLAENLKASFYKLKKLNLIKENLEFENVEAYKSKGCPKCSQTGYRGRFGIYEMLKINDNLRKEIFKDSSDYNIKKHFSGLTMFEDGLLKFFEGKTTIDEVFRVTNE
jgi:type II secretory ATPase GspE/PulE/Tfp pilus assembly ATPase PilB-like protein